MATSAKPLTTEAIALTEKKMDMSLDDIIKMSKPAKRGKTRVSNKNLKPLKNNAQAQDRTAKVKQYLTSRTSMRQGALAKKRSNFQANQFPVATAAARRVATATVRPQSGFIRNRAPNWNNSRLANNMGWRTNGGFNVKHLTQQQQFQRRQITNVAPRQRPQTLDSLFANMKEQRMKTQQTTSASGDRNRSFQQRQHFQRGPQAQQGRGRFHN